MAMRRGRYGRVNGRFGQSPRTVGIVVGERRGEGEVDVRGMSAVSWCSWRCHDEVQQQAALQSIYVSYAPIPLLVQRPSSTFESPLSACFVVVDLDCNRFIVNSLAA